MKKEGKSFVRGLGLPRLSSVLSRKKRGAHWSRTGKYEGKRKKEGESFRQL